MKCIQTLQAPESPSPSQVTSSPSSSPSYSSFHNPHFVSSADAALFEYTNNIKKSSPSSSSESASPVWSCSWSHDGKALATAHGRPSHPCIRIWKFDSLSNEWILTATLRHDESSNSSNNNTSSNDLPRTIRAVEFAYTPPNVRYVLACASFDGTVRIWEDFSFDSNGNVDKEQFINRRHHRSRNQNQYDNLIDDNSDNGCGDDDKRMNREIQASTNAGWENTAQLEGHENEVKDISWNSTGTLLATCGRDKTIWIWECFLPGTIGAEGNGSTSFNASIAGNNGGGGQGDFECISILTSHSGDVKDVEFTSSMNQFGDGDDILLSASYDDTIKVWAEEDGEWYCALTLSNVHSSTIWSIALSSSGLRMFSASADCSLGVWKFYTINEKRQMIQNEKNKNRDNNKTTKEDYDVGMMSDGLWKCVGKLPSAHKQPIYSVHCASARAGHGRIVTGGGDDSIHIFREINNNNHSSPDAPLFTTEVSVKKAHDGDVNCVRWHPLDGSLLASVGDDGLVKIWKFTP